MRGQLATHSLPAGTDIHRDATELGTENPSPMRGDRPRLPPFRLSVPSTHKGPVTPRTDAAPLPQACVGQTRENARSPGGYQHALTLINSTGVRASLPPGVRRPTPRRGLGMCGAAWHSLASGWWTWLPSRAANAPATPPRIPRRARNSPKWSGLFHRCGIQPQAGSLPAVRREARAKSCSPFVPHISRMPWKQRKARQRGCSLRKGGISWCSTEKASVRMRMAAEREEVVR